MPRRIRRSAAAAGVAACVALGLSPVPRAAGTDIANVDEVVGGAFNLAPGDGVSPVAAPPLELQASMRPAVKGVRVAIVSSGVDTAVLPSSLRPNVRVLGSAGDPDGYGTHAATVLLQLDPEARITSIGVYPNGRFNPDWQAGAFDWAKANAEHLDAVLYAVPPSVFPSPVAATMAAGHWDATVDAISRFGLPGDDGPLFGTPLNGSLRSSLTRQLPPAERALLDRFAMLNSRWAQARAQVRAITLAGVAVVAPAGDLGPGPQTVTGIANFPEVVAVGASTAGGVSNTSAWGPSMDGRVKPDLVAPTGLVGLLPPASALARKLGAMGLLDSALEPAWPAGPPATDARARLDSTMVSATVVAGATAGMAAQGIRDVARQRGALTASAVPLPAVPVWQQGAGVLQRVPDASFAASRPLALGHADLGVEPDSGTWSTGVAFAGGAPTGATTSLTDMQSVGVDGRPALAQVASSEAPPATATISNAGVEVSLPAGTEGYRGGLFCGYTEVSVPLTGAGVKPAVDIYGIPSGTEQVPTCLVKGNRLRGFGFYIHNTPAEDLTFGLLPAIPIGGDVLHHALMILPVDPLSTKLFFKVTDSEGNARFPNIPPGYYKIRQWSDYGAPVAEMADGQIVKEHDIGEAVAYQSFDSLVLPGLCTDDTPADDTSAGNNSTDTPRPCEEMLNYAFGDGNVEFEKPTFGYMVTTGPHTTRVIFDRFKKMPGAGVASRYIDLLDPVADLKFTSVDVAGALRAGDLSRHPSTSSSPVAPWTFLPSAGDPGKLVASPSPALSGAGTKIGTGVASYPFALSTPNYKAHMSLNFSYELTNAVIVVAVVVDRSVHYGVVTPLGTVQPPPVGMSSALAVPPVRAYLRSEGTARFDFHMLPRGAERGTIYFAFAPAYAHTVSMATVGDMSFELDTWTNTLWPATRFGSIAGHSFRIDSNFSERQMAAGDSPACRNGICEDWQMMVHSPGDDAATFDVVEGSQSDPRSVIGALRDAGGGLFDPRRGVHDFTHVLAFATPTVAGAKLAATVPNAFRTNGRFWEQLALPRKFLQSHAGVLEIRIEDDVAGRQTTFLPHSPGGVPVPAYRPLPPRSTALSLPAVKPPALAVPVL